MLTFNWRTFLQSYWMFPTNAYHYVTQRCHSRYLGWDTQVNWGRDVKHASKRSTSLYQLIIMIQWQQELHQVEVMRIPRPLGVDAQWRNQQDFLIWINMKFIHKVRGVVRAGDTWEITCASAASEVELVWAPVQNKLFNLVIVFCLILILYLVIINHN